MSMVTIVKKIINKINILCLLYMPLSGEPSNNIKNQLINMIKNSAVKNPINIENSMIYPVFKFINEPDGNLYYIDGNG